MRRPLIAMTLLVAAVFGAGYVIGQTRGITPSSAAGPAQSQPQTRTDAANGVGCFAGPHADGQVTAVNGNTLTIKADTARTGEQESVTTIVLTSSTQYFAGPGNSASKDSIKVGTYVIAQGTLSADGKTLTASQVAVLPSAPTGGGFGPFGGGSMSWPGATPPSAPTGGSFGDFGNAFGTNA